MVNLIIIVPLLSILCSTFADNNKQYQFFRSKHDIEFSRPIHQHFNLQQSADRQQRNLPHRKQSLNTLTQEARSIQSNQDGPQLHHKGVQAHQERPHSRQGGQQVHQGVHHANQNQHGVENAHQGIPKRQQGVFTNHQKKLHQGAVKKHQGVSQIKQGVPQNGQRLPQLYRGATQNVKSQHHNIQHEKQSNLANQKQALRHPQQSHHPSILSNQYQHTPHPHPVPQKLTTDKKTVTKPGSPVLPRITNKVPRKIDQTPLKLSKNNILSEKLQNSFKTKNAQKENVKENEAKESKLEVTKVKAPKQHLKHEKETPVKPAKEEKKPDVVEHRDYKVASKPKFIIKPAGPSQQYGWVGHGHYGPLNLQNIFRQAGINTQWISGENAVFEAGLTYPAPPSKHQPAESNSSPPAYEHPTTKTHTTASPSYAPSTAPVSSYSPPIAASSYVAPTTSAPVYIPASPSLPEYQPPVYIPKSTSPPVYSAAPVLANLPVYQDTLFRETAASSAPVYNAPAPAYEAPAAAPAYEAPAYKAPAPAYEAPAPAYEAPVPAPAYEAPAPAYEAPAPAPAYDAPASAPAYEAPAQAPAPAKAYFGPQSTFESASDENTFDLYNSPSSTASPPVFTDSSPSPSYSSPSIQNNYASPQFNFPGESGYIFPQQSYQPSPSPAPFTASPSPSSYQPSPSPFPYQGSPSPAPYQPSPSPAPYQPSPSPSPYQGSPSPAPYQPSPSPSLPQPSPTAASYQAEYQKPAPFTAFKSFNSPSPSDNIENVPVLETQEPFNDIFLKNDSPISEIVDLRTSQSVESVQGTNGLTPESDVFYIYYENENQNEQDEVDVGKLEDAEPYSGEIFGDDNIIPSFSVNEDNNVPLFYDIPLRVEENGEGFDPPSEIRTIYVPVENAINVPSSFDINVGTTLGKSKNKPGSSFPNFPNYNSGSGSPKQGGVDVYESEGVKIRRPVRRPQSPVVFETEVIDENNVSSVPFGTRLSPREQYDPLTLRR